MNPNEKAALDAAVKEHGITAVLIRMVDRLEYLSTVLRFESEAATAVDAETTEAIRHFKKVSDLYDRFNDVKKTYNEVYDRMSREAIPEILRRDGIKTINVIGVGRVSVAHRYSCSMIDKEAGMEWLEKTGNESLIQKTVNSSTLAAFAKNLIQEEGKELPPEIFKVGTSPYTSITATK